MKIVVGLGNPGSDYDGTPHNVGFDVMDVLAKKYEGRFRNSSRANAREARVLVDEQPMLLVKPETFVNRSGEAVVGVMQYHHAALEDLMVVLDDADLSLGWLRLRGAGSSGGHRGLASVIELLGSDAFARLRLGVGRDRDGADLVKHVLTSFSVEERPAVDAAVVRATEAVTSWARVGLERTMNTFNTRRIAKNEEN